MLVLAIVRNMLSSQVLYGLHSEKLIPPPVALRKMANTTNPDEANGPTFVPATRPLAVHVD
jgi:hypothetical protein